jgi:ribosome-interacting GTPase 1
MSLQWMWRLIQRTGQLKAKLAKLKRELLTPSSGSGGGGGGEYPCKGIKIPAVH